MSITGEHWEEVTALLQEQLRVVTAERDELLRQLEELTAAIGIGQEPTWRLVSEIDAMRSLRVRPPASPFDEAALARTVHNGGPKVTCE